jgi:hypothetical protein
MMFCFIVTGALRQKFADQVAPLAGKTKIKENCSGNVDF